MTTMKTKLLTALAFVLALGLTFFIVACADRSMERVIDVPTSTITWLRRSPVTCGGYPQIYGCAEWNADRSRCTITMPDDASDIVTGHEFRHCFGYDHIAPR